MAKRQRNARTVGNMMPFGKPAQIKVERVMFGKDKDGNVDVRYVETYEGSSITTDSKTAKDTGKVVSKVESGLDEHANGCKGRPGVSRVFHRGGHALCASCYEFRWGVSPYFDKERENERGQKLIALHEQKIKDQS